MDCDDYLRDYLSAQADSQLTVREQGFADLHLRRCRVCRCYLVEERVLKALVRRTLRIVKTPTKLKLQIRSALREPVTGITPASAIFQK